MAYDPSRNTELAMVRGIMTQHVMEAVSKEMFGGAQGKKYIDQALPEIAASSNMKEGDKKALLQMLRSVEDFYNRPGQSSATQADPGPRGITMPYTVKEQAMTS